MAQEEGTPSHSTSNGPLEPAPVDFIIAPERIPTHNTTPGMRYGENVPRDWGLPPYLWCYGQYFDRNLPALEASPAFFHGTRLSRVKDIVAAGYIRGFPEVDSPVPKVYGTPDPVVAAYHAHKNGPEDTFTGGTRAKPSDPVVILKFNLEKIYTDSDELERYRAIARHEYRQIRRGLPGDNAAYVMGMRDFTIPADAIEVMIPEGAHGEMRDLPLIAFYEEAGQRLAA